MIFLPTISIGGIERVLLTYAAGLVKKNYDVTCLIAVDKKELDINKIENINFVCLNKARLRKSLWAIVKYLKINKPDVIITASDATLIVFLAKLFSSYSAKLITSHHNYYDNNTEIKSRQRLIVKYIYPLCDNVIGVSNGISSMLRTQFNLKNVITIYNPIDYKFVTKSSEELVEDIPREDYFLFIGRFSTVKNIPLLFSAYKIFIQKYPNVRLVLIGDGEEKYNLLKKISVMNLSNSIDVMGVKSNPFPYIKKASLIVLSSLSEALPTVLIESLLLGRTTVSTPTKGAIDILDNGRLGYLSNSLIEATDLSEKMIIAYENPLKEEVLINEAMNRYNLDEKISQLEKIWIKI